MRLLRDRYLIVLMIFAVIICGRSASVSYLHRPVQFPGVFTFKGRCGDSADPELPRAGVGGRLRTAIRRGAFRLVWSLEPR